MVTQSAGASDALPLRGVGVVDFTHMLSGPYCTWVLAALGADVVKIERPGSGDFARGVAPFSDGESLYFQSVNRGKRSIALDLKAPEDLAVARSLVERADVLVENNRPGVMDRLGLGFERVRELNRGIVYASVSGFGATSPYRDRPAFDAIIQAMSGLMSITGAPEGPPTRVGASVSDIGAGLFAAIGILAALQAPQRKTDGVFLDVSMLDCQLAVLENAIGRVLNTGTVPGRVGNRHPLITPFQSFDTADHAIVVCCDTDPQWSRFCGVIGRKDLAAEARYATAALRTEAHAELEPVIADALRQRPAEVWLDLLHGADVPAAPINDLGEVVRDPHFEERRMGIGPPGARFVNLPIFQALVAEAPSPKLDQHRDEILRQLEQAGRFPSGSSETR